MHIQNNNSFQRRDWRIRYLWKFPTWTIAQRVITSIATPTACPRISVIVGVLQESYRGLTGVLQDYTFQPEHLPSLCHLWHLQKTQKKFQKNCRFSVVFVTYTCILYKWVFLIYTAEYKNDLSIFHNLKLLTI